MKGEDLRFIDIHLAGFLAERSGFKGEERKRFCELVELLSSALESGHSCLRLDDSDKMFVMESHLVSEGTDTPLVVQGDRLYLQRYYSYESKLAGNLLMLAAEHHHWPQLEVLLDEYFGRSSSGEDYQREAARLAMQRSLCLISGGPGTGKTTTVVRILALMLELFGKQTRIGLAAPTGKAAMRLQESITASLPYLPVGKDIAKDIPRDAMTLHRLLGVIRNTPRFMHNHDNPLPLDVLVIDEASMVDLAMMSKVVDALKPGARLILLGDKDQLASVESGAVLADCIRGLPENTIELRKSYRFETGIGTVAKAINRGDGTRCFDLLHGDEFDNISFLQEPLRDFVGSRYKNYMECVRSYPATTLDEIFSSFGEFQVLCGTRHGARGLNAINNAVEGYLKTSGYYCLPGDWYPGRPVMVTRNDYNLGLFNGDIGICLSDPENDTLNIWFDLGNGAYRYCPPYRLPASETVFAMTIHKSQGSEFRDVLVVLPETDNRVLNRQLVYTAVTRARERLWLKADERVLVDSLCRDYERSSGLMEMLQGKAVLGRELSIT
ncbi:exodeoxyribonuclease V subunit alpha [Desulfopila sp. IMCC35008]|uniref:exodeoxyribonuclease V subunit alpha n=1 Tax=Desulfopila sp. IMCC35008 TaxID=2653858 RepID=UPI0013D6AE58|nr:exodeoxyribonuclease V subunit alpha [Desulfopila sp. IMCC35008]